MPSRRVALRTQRDTLLNLHLDGKIDVERFSAKDVEIRDRMARLTLLLEATDRGRDEHADLARKAFELSQSLPERWVAADYTAKRQILEIVCLNFTLDGISLVPEWRKPFDVLVGGLPVSSSRGDRRWTFPNQSAGQLLILQAVTQTIVFTADELTDSVRP